MNIMVHVVKQAEVTLLLNTTIIILLNCLLNVKQLLLSVTQLCKNSTYSTYYMNMNIMMHVVKQAEAYIIIKQQLYFTELFTQCEAIVAFSYTIM